ncbi:hypothetical protein GYMLUDRAFT_62926 [Collybiopsis luxurians FD-317 M1]|uniref:Uncharacterized protein n=1 Tax=Collybiopsis luxurians FD-317 M1 TaxID=944289 RepID=A0A0D0AVW1_9AGAR|nr:hypothetical protein GYMLUDRAFT_62926 [Collybiopsis luxurians FD-317 M1]
MPPVTYVDCPCTQCSRKNLALHAVSWNLHNKHVKKHGLPQPEPAISTLNSLKNYTKEDVEGDSNSGSGSAVENKGHVELGNSRNGDVDLGLNDEEHKQFPLQQEDLPWWCAASPPGYDDLPPEPEQPPPEYEDPPAVPDTVFHELKIPPGPELGLDPDFSSGVAPTFAKSDIPAVRLAYLQAVYNNIVNHLSVNTTNENLSMTLNCIEVTGTLADDQIPVQTLIST